MPVVPCEIRKEFTPKLFEADRQLHANAPDRNKSAAWKQTSIDCWAYLAAEKPVASSGEHEDRRRLVFWQGIRKLGGLSISGTLIVCEPLCSGPAEETMEQPALVTSNVYSASRLSTAPPQLMVFSRPINKLGDLSRNKEITSALEGLGMAFRTGLLYPDSAQCMDLIRELQRGALGNHRLGDEFRYPEIP